MFVYEKVEKITIDTNGTNPTTPVHMAKLGNLATQTSTLPNSIPEDTSSIDASTDKDINMKILDMVETRNEPEHIQETAPFNQLNVTSEDAIPQDDSTPYVGTTQAPENDRTNMPPLM